MHASGKGQDPERGASPWAYVGLGFELAIPPVLGVFAGYYLDRWLGTAPWLLIVGVLMGIVLGFYSFLRSVLPPRRRNG